MPATRAAKQAEKPKRPRGLRLRPDGRAFHGALVNQLVRTGQRCAVWTAGAAGPDDMPAVCGVLLGINFPRDGAPQLAVAVNDDVRHLPLADVAYACPLAGDQAHPEVGA